MNSFGSGINVSGGVPYSPGVRFINSSSTGLFSFTQHTLGISAYGQICAIFNHELTNFFTDIRIQKNARDRAVLTSDSVGNARWEINSVGKSVQWNTIYKDIDVDNLDETNKIEISFDIKLPKVPTVVTTKESDTSLNDIDFFIKDKTDTGFTLYSNSFMAKKIISDDLVYYASVRLSNGGIGICYYNVTLDRMQYFYSDKSYSTFSSHITIDDVSSIGLCDITLVDGFPAIVYIADDGSGDMWKYVRASDELGSSWGSPVTLETSSEDITFLANAIFLRVVDGIPTVFYNNDKGRAKYFKSQDTIGSLWNASVNLSNLSNHRIVGVSMVAGNPAVIARSNITNYIYYVRSTNASGTSWPLGATQLYKQSGVPMIAGVGNTCDAIAFIHDSLYVITTEFDSNSLYIIKANDGTGSSWGYYQFLATSSTPSVCPCIFKNGDDYYILYNSYVGSPSKKNIIRIKPSDNIADLSSRCFIESLPYSMDHLVLENSNTFNTLLVSSERALSLIKFYGDDFKINWIAMA
jgi:hypothetical protein